MEERAERSRASKHEDLSLDPNTYVKIQTQKPKEQTKTSHDRMCVTPSLLGWEMGGSPSLAGHQPSSKFNGRPCFKE